MVISAEDVKQLREKTSAGIMDCKKALIETNGNIEKAIEYLRKKGIAAAEKRIGRETKEGLIESYIHLGSRLGVLVEVNCETDFVSRTDKYRDFVQNLAKRILDRGVEDVQSIPEEISTLVKEAIATFGENIVLRKIARMKKTDEKRSVFQSYIHLDGKVGVIVEFLVGDPSKKENEEFLEFAKNIALQVASMGPAGVSRDDLPKEIVEEQREIFTTQARESGKPENILDKIVKGRMEKFFAETSLLEQKYVKNNDLTCDAYRAETQKKIGTDIEIKRLARFKLGEE